MKKYLGVLVVGFTLSLALVAQPALARTHEARATEAREQGQVRSEEARVNTEERVSNIKQQVAERRAAIRQEVCERRQQQLTTVMPRLANGATSVKTAFDSVYDRVQGFYDNGQLTVANYDELKSNVDVAKADAEAALEAVQTYEFELDCESRGVGGQLDGFRTAVQEAREALKAYRAELVELIKALKAEAANQQEGTEQAETEEGESDDE